jgi:UDP-glucose 4-epimerase
MDRQKLALVTGGAGFIGSHLCERLQSDGYRVISLDNYFTGSKDNHILGVEYREGHTKDIATLVPEDPDIIYHLGEYSRVEVSLSEPEIVWDLNVWGTFAVAEYWRAKKCKLVYAGSSTKFGDGGLNRNMTPYAWTKATNTELVCNYGAWYTLPFAVAYFYNVYGPGERSGKYGTVVEIFRQKCKVGEPLMVELPGTQTRNFTHVADIVSGLVAVGERGIGDDFGIGNERAYTIIELAHLFGADPVLIPSRPGNRTSSAIDTSKTRALGWNPSHQLETYVQECMRSK